MHGGVDKKELNAENVEALLKGIPNLEKHIENISKYNVPYVVAINKFHTDTENEVKALELWAKEHGHPVALTEVWAKGGEGGIELANKVLKEIEEKDGSKTFKPIYETNLSVEEKINAIARKIYGADGVEFLDMAKEQIKAINENGWDNLPICVAKTQYSLSDDAKKLGRPEDFTITVKEVRVSNGAGFVVVITGTIMTMPGLPKVPAAERVDVLPDGTLTGIF
jgi:formate--tetrahydrofolate ligase